jgi:hypothetical protein
MKAKKWRRDSNSAQNSVVFLRKTAENKEGILRACDINEK